jgi:hypothetical protein
MAATLASYGSALALEHAEGLGLGVVVLAVVLALTLSRRYHAGDRREWLLGLAVLSLLALAASEVGSLLVRDADVGDALFVLAVSGSIWIRRFGPGFARAGTLVALPFVTLLVAPAVPGAARPHLFWAAVVGAVAYLWVSLARWLGERTHFVEHVVHAGRRRVEPAAARRAGRGAASTASRGQIGRRLPASTRMALQMGAALAIAFAVGRTLFGVHWSWLVMTAFIVSSGNRGRGDVLYKSGLRIAGAAVGTVAATLLAGRFAPGDATTVVVIFVVLGVANWLRAFSYAYWAAGVTSVLALLYGYFGETGTHLLPQRLEGIVLGALIAICVSWLLMPVRTVDVLRRRLADALAALGDALAALTADSQELARHALRFEHALAALEEIARPLEVHRLLVARAGTRAYPASRVGGRAHPADSIDALRDCRTPLASLTEQVAADPGALAMPGVERHRKLAAAKLVDARRALGGRHEGREDHAVAVLEGDDHSSLEAALAELDAALMGVLGSCRALRR